jgi:hypothetical protein
MRACFNIVEGEVKEIHLNNNKEKEMESFTERSNEYL